MFHRPLLMFLGITIATSACSGEPTPRASSDSGTSASSSGGGGGEGGGGGGGGSGGEGGAAATPAVHFVDGEGAVVTRLRYGEPFAVVVAGLKPQSQVTLESALPGYAGSAAFDVGDSGEVDTRVDAPVDGTYDGAEPEGLLWSMLATPSLGGMGIDVTVSAKVGGQKVATATLERGYLNDDLVKEDVTEKGLVGVLYKPADAIKPLPALLIMGGSEGGIEGAAFDAAWFAGYGYAALGLAYFDEPGLPSELADIPLEYFGAALDLLATRPDVDPNRIGVIGGSRGGELVLMLGEYFPSVRAVVAKVPSGLRWGSVDPTKGGAWTYEGAGLPYMHEPPNAQPVAEELENGATAYRFTPMFQATIDGATPDELAAATIHVESTHGPILMLAGEDDALWPSCTLSKFAMDRLDAAGHSVMNEDALLCFPKAGHFTPRPGWPTTGSYAIKFGSYWLVLGGTPKGNARAQRQGLTAIRTFLAQHL